MVQRKTFGWKLPPEIEARLGDDTYGRQRAIYEVGHLLLLLHLPPKASTIERETLVFLRKPDGSFHCNGLPEGEKKLRGLIAEYRKLWEECDKEYDAAQSARELFQLLERLAPLNRATTNMASVLQAARDHVKEDRLLLNLRDESYEVSRAFDLLVIDAKLKLDYKIASNAEQSSAKAEEMAAAQHKLNVLAALTFPVMALATVLGMNLTHGFEERTPAIFFGVLTFAFALGVLVRRWVAR